MRGACILVLLLCLAAHKPAFGAGYRNYPDIVTAVNNMASGSGGYGVAFDAGTTIKGTKIRGIVISKNATAANNGAKPDVIIFGTIHAREWIAAEVCVAIGQYLVDKRNDTAAVVTGFKDMNINKLLENAEIVIVPVLNPDGYKWSRNEQNPAGSPTDVDPAWDPNNTPDWNPGWGPIHYNDWRKNRRDTSAIPASADTEAGAAGDVGVDCNRNFPFHWDPPQAAYKDPTAYQTYRGPSAGSEEETKVEMALINGRDVMASIDYHSYGDDVLYPWGHTTAKIPDANEFLRPNTKTKDNDLFPELAQKMAGLIGGYTAQQSVGLYATSGGSEDWAYNARHCASFVVELGSNADGFQPAPARIAPISNANINGARWLMFWAADQALKNKPAVKKP